MTKTSRTHCARPVKTYYTKVVCIVVSCLTKDYEAQTEIRRFIPCKGNHKALPVERKQYVGIFCFTTSVEYGFIASRSLETEILSRTHYSASFSHKDDRISQVFKYHTQ